MKIKTENLLAVALWIIWLSAICFAVFTLSGCLDYEALSSGTKLTLPHDGSSPDMLSDVDLSPSVTPDGSPAPNDMTVDPCAVPHTLVHRLLGSDFKHHCYTPSTGSTPGTDCYAYTEETGVPVFYVATAPAPGLTTLYRCFQAGVYRLTTDAACEEWGATYMDGVVGYIPTSPMCSSHPLYRDYSTNDGYFYTPDSTEAGAIATLGAPYNAWLN